MKPACKLLSRSPIVHAAILATVFASLAACTVIHDDGALAKATDPAAPAVPGPSEAPAAPSYTTTLFDHARIGSNLIQANYQTVETSVHLASAPFASVKLVVDLESPCFPFDKWKTNKPPFGQNWPADCDAFDRTFEMTLADPASPTTPRFDVVHAITPFGGPLHVEQDVTDLFNAVKGDRTFGVSVTTNADLLGKVSGSAGSWIASAHLEVTPGAAPRTVLAAIPLFFGEVKDSKLQPDVLFTLPPGTTASVLEYRVTGHGGVSAFATGCSGPADEFCMRTHYLRLDGRELKTLSPWRDDCSSLCTMVTGDKASPFGAYCKENPCGSPESVRAPRANWCPGSVTPAFQVTLDAAPGQHAFFFGIDGIAPGAMWLTSAVVYAYGAPSP